jgi:hypothetical protein
VVAGQLGLLVGAIGGFGEMTGPIGTTPANKLEASRLCGSGLNN